MDNLPDYIARDGELLASAPIRIKTLLYTFLLDADWNALNTLCDRYLNLGGDTVYRPLFPGVFLYFSQVDNYPLTDQIGWCPEYDFGVWVPVAAGKADGPVFHPERMLSFTPYIWVDNGVAMLGGRTVFGFMKQIGNMTMPKAPGDPASFALETQVIETYGPQSPMVPRPLLEAHRLDAGVWEELKQAEAGAGNGLRALYDIVSSRGAAHLPLPGPEFLLRTLHTLGHSLPMVFLKQFPDAANARKACYQAVVEASVDIQSKVEWGWLPGEYGATIWKYDSHNLVKSLGLRADQDDGHKAVVKSLLHSWMRFEAVVQPGTIIYQRHASAVAAG